MHFRLRFHFGRRSRRWALCPLGLESYWFTIMNICIEEMLIHRSDTARSLWLFRNSFSIFLLRDHQISHILFKNGLFNSDLFLRVCDGRASLSLLIEVFEPVAKLILDLQIINNFGQIRAISSFFFFSDLFHYIWQVFDFLIFFIIYDRNAKPSLPLVASFSICSLNRKIELPIWIFRFGWSLFIFFFALL